MTEATMTDDSAPAWAERVTRFDYDGPDAPQEVRYTGLNRPRFDAAAV